MKIQSFVIHLKRATKRRQNAERLIAQLPYKPKIFEAVDGKQLSEDQLNAVYSRRSFFKPNFPFPMSNGEIACFLSHRELWQKIVDEELDGALIVEDDVKLNVQKFKKAIDCCLPLLAELGYIQFQVRSIEDKFECLHQTKVAAIFRPKVVPLRTSCQLISNAMAKKLLSISQKIDRPVDGFLQLSWETGHKPVYVEPSGVSDLTKTLEGSTIAPIKPTGIFAKIYREVNRLLYRWAIYRYSSRWRKKAR